MLIMLKPIEKQLAVGQGYSFSENIISYAGIYNILISISFQLNLSRFKNVSMVLLGNKAQTLIKRKIFAL